MMRQALKNLSRTDFFFVKVSRNRFKPVSELLERRMGFFFFTVWVFVPKQSSCGKRVQGPGPAAAAATVRRKKRKTCEGACPRGSVCPCACERACACACVWCVRYSVGESESEGKKDKRKEKWLFLYPCARSWEGKKKWVAEPAWKKILRERKKARKTRLRERERECVAEERDSARVRAKIFLGVVSGGACVVRVLPRSKDSKVKLYFRARSKVKQNSFFEHRQK